MLKLLFTGLLVYLFYRLLVKPARLHAPPDRQADGLGQGSKAADDDEYIDYEEVE